MRGIDHLLPVYEIFTNKNWHSRAETGLVLQNFIQLLSNLNPIQQALIIDLVKRYNWFCDNDIKIMLNDITDKLSTILSTEPYDNIYALPLKLLKKKNTIKSPDPLIYKLNGLYFKLKENLKNVKILENIEKIPKNVNSKDLILLFDDFIGTGNSVKDVVDELHRIKNDVDVIIMSLVGMTQGLNYLDENGIKCVVSKEFKKEISEYYPEPTNQANLEIMESIEELIQVKGYNLGYGSSEALVTLEKTPNNTFSIFWSDHKKDGTLFKAPFPRY